MKTWQKVFWILYTIASYFLMFNYVFNRINWGTIIFSTVAIGGFSFFIWAAYEEFSFTSLGIYIERKFESEEEKEKRLMKEKEEEERRKFKRREAKLERKRQIPKMKKEISYLYTKLESLDEEEIYINYDPDKRKALQDEKLLIRQRIESLESLIGYYEE